MIPYKPQDFPHSPQQHNSAQNFHNDIEVEPYPYNNQNMGMNHLEYLRHQNGYPQKITINGTHKVSNYPELWFIITNYLH